jgi:hypothetical protein
LAGETEILGGNLPHSQFVHHKSHMTRSVFEPGPPRWEASDYFFYLVCEAIGIAATAGLLCQPRVIVKMIVGKQMECRLARETEVLGENLPQPSQNSHMTRPVFEPPAAAVGSQRLTA